jgi:hypothetical protein
MYYCYDRNIVGNKFTNNKINSNGASGFHYLFYAWYNYNSYRAVNLFEDNVIDSNSSGGYWYTFYGYYNGNQRVSRNKITNTMTGSTYGLFYGFMFYYSYNLSIYSNLISNNLLQELSSKLEGELFFDTTMRILYATDASAYREMPLAVSIPQSINDLKILIQFATDNGTSLIPLLATLK